MCVCTHYRDGRSLQLLANDLGWDGQGNHYLGSGNHLSILFLIWPSVHILIFLFRRSYKEVPSSHSPQYLSMGDSHEIPHSSRE